MTAWHFGFGVAVGAGFCVGLGVGFAVGFVVGFVVGWVIGLVAVGLVELAIAIVPLVAVGDGEPGVERPSVRL